MNSTWRSLGLAGAAAVLVAAPPASAHHAATMYDQTKLRTGPVQVKSVRWVNPHVYVTVVTEPEDKTWTVELSSPGVLTRAGFSKRTFNPGDKINMTFAPMRNGSAAGLYRSATLADGKVMTWNFKPGEGANLE